MKYYITLTITLLIFCAVGSGVLAYVNSITAPVIKERKANEAIEARKSLIPGADFESHTAKADSSFEYFIAYKQGTKDILGYTFTAVRKGYAAAVKTMVGLDKDMKIISIKVIEQNETPGLGTNATLPGFTDQFKGKGVDDLMVDKDGGVPGKCIKAMSGATITTRAVTYSVRDQIAMLKTDLESAEGAAK